MMHVDLIIKNINMVMMNCNSEEIKNGQLLLKAVVLLLLEKLLKLMQVFQRKKFWMDLTKSCFLALLIVMVIFFNLLKGLGRDRKLLD